MKRLGVIVGLVAAAWAIAGCQSTVVDFRDAIAASKVSVFPALVYVMVVSESGANGKIEKVQSSGSGVLVSESGELLTNHHVVERATRIRCQLTDGRMFDAQVIGKDKDLDVALLKLVAPEGTAFPCAKLSGRKLEVGEVVLAMGAPWGLARSVSMGIISCNDRYLENCGDYTLWYQTDAAISPGNSGGPLVDTAGEVVGLNARGNMFGDQAFTIPSATILEVLPSLRESGDAHWAWFGVNWQPLKDFELDIAFGATNGVIVAGTDSHSPARAAGLEPNDRVIAIDGRPVTAMFREDIPDLNRELALRPWDRAVVFDFVRTGVVSSVTITPKSKGRVDAAEVEFQRWGFTAKEINRFDKPDLAFFAPDGGVFVSSVSWDGNADNAGFKTGDIVRSVGADEVKSISALQGLYAAAMTNLATTVQVRVGLLRKGRQVNVILNYRNDPDKEED